MIVDVNVQPAGGHSWRIRILTEDVNTARLPGEQTIFVSENTSNLCHNLPFKTVREAVAPDGHDGRK